MKRTANLIIIWTIVAIVSACAASASDMGPIVSGETRSGEIASVGQTDTWRFTANTGDRLILHVVVTSGTFDPDVQVLDAAGKVVAEQYSGTHRSGHVALDFVVQSGAPHAILIRDTALTRTGTYNITLVNLTSGPYNSKEDPDGGDILSGPTLAPAGQMNLASDLDVFHFSASLGDRIILHVVRTSGDFDYDVQVLDADGNVVAKQYSGNAKLDFVVQSGAPHVILIRDTALTRTGTYNITLEREGRPDLKVGVVVDPNVIPDGQDSEVHCTVVNVGDTNAPSTRLRVYVSPHPSCAPADPTCPCHDPNCVEQGTQIDGEKTIPSLKAGETFATELTLPAGTYDVGCYCVCAVVGPVPEESDLNNNVACACACVVPPCSLNICPPKGGHVVKPGENDIFQYPYGTRVPIEAKPDEFYRFVQWTGTAVDEKKVADPCSPDTTVLVDGAYTLCPFFAKDVVFLSIQVVGCGTVEPNVVDHPYDRGTTVQIKAAPCECYGFTGWSGSCIDNVADPCSSDTTVVMDADCTLVAHFDMVAPEEPKVSTEPPVDVNCTSATLRGFVVSYGCDTCDYSFEYWPEGQQERSGTGWKPVTEREISEPISDLRPGTMYCYQALLRNSVGTGRGEIRCFQTTSPSAQITISSTAGGTVVEPGIGVFAYCETNVVAVKAEVTNPNYYFWCWLGSAMDTGKIPAEDVTRPNTTVLVDANDTLRAAFLRRITQWDDDVDRTWRRGSRLSTSQLWEFGDTLDWSTGVPEGVFDVTGTAPNGRTPLPGTCLGLVGQNPNAGIQGWPTDPYSDSGRKGLVATSGLRASINVWPSNTKATSVWVQILWHDLYSIGARPLLMDLDPIFQNWRMIGDMSLSNGWHHTTYAWNVDPGPDQVRFTIGGQIVVDWIIVETYIEN